MPKSKEFKWRHYEPEIILLCVRWYLTYPLSYRQVAEMVLKRGLDVHHTEIEKRCRPHLRSTNDSWRVDKTYIQVKGKWKYLYRAVDSQGKNLDFLLTAHRDAQASIRFLRKLLKALHIQEPRGINVDKNSAYPQAIEQLKEKKELSKRVELRQNKYLNNRVELRTHRFIKRLVKPGMGCGLVQHGKTNDIGLRNHEHAEKGTSEKS
jgi:transposase-like protein